LSARVESALSGHVEVKHSLLCVMLHYSSVVLIRGVTGICLPKRAASHVNESH